MLLLDYCKPSPANIETSTTLSQPSHRLSNIDLFRVEPVSVASIQTRERKANWIKVKVEHVKESKDDRRVGGEAFVGWCDVGGATFRFTTHVLRAKARER